MSIDFRVRGTEGVRANLSLAMQLVPDQVAGAALEEVEIELAESKKIAPLDEGVLVNSGFVTQPERQGGRIVTEIGYGGAASAYAVVQHEDPDLIHPNGREWKYLERPLKESSPFLIARIGRRVRLSALG